MAERRVGPGQPGEDEHRMPRWVKALIAVGLVAVALVLVVFALTGGEHGPGRHLPGGDDAEFQSPDGHAPPVDRG